MFSIACIRQTSAIADGLIYPCVISDPPMEGIQDQKTLVNKTRTPLQDLVVLGGLIMISATDGSVTVRAITLVHAIGTLDHCLGKEEIAREMSLVTLMMKIRQIAR